MKVPTHSLGWQLLCDGVWNFCSACSLPLGPNTSLCYVHTSRSWKKTSTPFSPPSTTFTHAVCGEGILRLFLGTLTLCEMHHPWFGGRRLFQDVDNTLHSSSSSSSRLSPRHVTHRDFTSELHTHTPGSRRDTRGASAAAAAALQRMRLPRRMPAAQSASVQAGGCPRLWPKRRRTRPRPR